MDIFPIFYFLRAFFLVLGVLLRKIKFENIFPVIGTIKEEKKRTIILIIKKIQPNSQWRVCSLCK